MFRMTTLAVSLALAVAATATGAAPALARCYAPAEVRQLVDEHRVVSLSSLLGEINAIGQPVSSPELCDSGGGYTYSVDVVAGGKVIHLSIDGRSGTVSR